MTNKQIAVDEMQSTSSIQEEVESTSSQDTPNTRGETETSQSTCSTVPEREISIWLDEKEEQNAKRQALNDSLNKLTDGRVSPLQSTLNTEWDDISTNLQDLRLEVYNDLRKPEHPIEVEEYNVCQLTQKNKLISLKVNYLKTICETIGLTIEGPQTRKKSYVKPLEELVKSCTCNN